MKDDTLYFDALVLGNGLAGIVSALTLLEKRKKVAIVCLKKSIEYDVDEGEYLTSQLLFSYLQRSKVLQSRKADPLRMCDSGLQYIQQDKKRFTCKTFFQVSNKVARVQKSLLSFLYHSRVHLPGESRRERKHFLKALESSGVNLNKEGIDLSENSFKSQLSTLLPYVFRVFPNPFSSQGGNLRFNENILWEEGLEDVSNLKKMLLNRVKTLGGTLISINKFNSIEVHRRRFKVFHVGKNHPIRIIPKTVIVGGRIEGLESSIEKDRHKRRWRKNFLSSQAQVHKVSKCFWLSSEALPVKLKMRGIWKDETQEVNRNRRKLPRAFKYIVKKCREDDSKWKVVVSTYVTEPDTDSQRLENEFARFARQIIPFAEKKDSGLMRWTQNTKGDVQEFLLSELSSENEIWPLQYRNCTTNMKNVFVANREVLPTLGVDGELITGMHVGSVLAQKLVTYF